MQLLESQLNIPSNCTNMAEIMVGLGEDEDSTEKLITACGVQLGQCQVCIVNNIQTQVQITEHK